MTDADTVIFEKRIQAVYETFVHVFSKDVRARAQAMKKK